MNPRALLPAICLALLPASAGAQDTGEIAEPVPLYQVEVIIFRHVDQSQTTAEIPHLVEPEIADVLDQQLPRLVAGDTIDSTAITDGLPADVAERAWQPASAELYMAADARRIERLQAYELISHLAWVQPATDIAVAIPVSANVLGAPLPVNGEFKLYRKRYLHLAVDVMLDTTAGSSGLTAFRETAPAAPAIVDSRRMRFGRTAYFDQPQFGLIAVVNKIEEPAAETPAG